MPTIDKPPPNSDTGDPVPMLCSKRWLLAYITAMGLVLVNALRVNMSVAIVCMVRDSNETSDTTSVAIGNHTSSQQSSSCQASQNNNDGDIGEFDWDKSTQSIVLSSYFYGYIGTQLPGGWLASRFGGKRVVSFSVLLVSIATVLLPEAARWDYKAVVALRVFMGLTQGVTYPAINAMLGRWAAREESTRISSFIYIGPKVGMVLTYITSGQLCSHGFDNGWPSIFYIQGGLGVLWVCAWLFIAADTPDTHPTISKAERDYIVNSIGNVENKKYDVPWMSILKSRALMAVLVAHICHNWTHYTLLTSLPIFMKEVLKFDIQQNGLLSSIPYMAMAVFSISSGHAADFIRRTYLNTTQTRRLFQSLALLLSGSLVVSVGYVPCDQRVLAVALISIGTGFAGFSSAGYMVNPMDFAPRHAGILMGITNCVATLPGILSPLVIGQITPNKSQEEWRNVFYICGGFALVGTLVFGVLVRGELEPWAVESDDDDNDDERGTEKTPKGVENSAFSGDERKYGNKIRNGIVHSSGKLWEHSIVSINSLHAEKNKETQERSTQDLTDISTN